MKEFVFKTKYDLGEKVFAYTSSRRAIEGEIEKISFNRSYVDSQIWYIICGEIVQEEHVYPSKEEFIKTLTPCE